MLPRGTRRQEKGASRGASADMPTKPKKSRIPRFRSLEAEAEFWDTHDSTEFEDEFKEVELKFAKPLRHFIEVELPGETLDALFATALAKGIPFTELVRQWIEEHLLLETPAGTPRGKTSKPKAQATA